MTIGLLIDKYSKSKRLKYRNNFSDSWGVCQIELRRLVNVQNWDCEFCRTIAQAPMKRPISIYTQKCKIAKLSNMKKWSGYRALLYSNRTKEGNTTEVSKVIGIGPRRILEHIGSNDNCYFARPTQRTIGICVAAY